MPGCHGHEPEFLRLPHGWNLGTEITTRKTLENWTREYKPSQVFGQLHDTELQIECSFVELPLLTQLGLRVSGMGTFANEVSQPQLATEAVHETLHRFNP